MDKGKLQVIGQPLETSIEDICSLKFCRVSKSETLLAVGGSNPNYEDSKTDVFDASELFKLHQSKRESPLKSEIPKPEKSSNCQCNSQVILQMMFTKMEYYMTEFFSKMISTFERKTQLGRNKQESNLLIPII